MLVRTEFGESGGWKCIFNERKWSAVPLTLTSISLILRRRDGEEHDCYTQLYLSMERLSYVGEIHFKPWFQHCAEHLK